MFKLGKFVSEVKIEMKKVAWPSRQELVSSTVVVLISVFLLGIFIGVCDFIFSKAVNVLISGVF